MQIVRDMLNEAGSSEEDEEEGVEGEEGEVFGSGDEDTRSDYTEDNEDNEEDDDEVRKLQVYYALPTLHTLSENKMLEDYIRCVCIFAIDFIF